MSPASAGYKVKGPNHVEYAEDMYENDMIGIMG